MGNRFAMNVNILFFGCDWFGQHLNLFNRF